VTSSRLIAWLALGFVVASAHLRAADAAEEREVALKRVNLLVSDLDRPLAVSRALALTEVKGVELPAPPSIGTSSPVIRIARFNEVPARQRAAGLSVVEPRRSRTPEGREFSELGFTDPDGHVVVLHQLD
jgi:hypothetical protein